MPHMKDPRNIRRGDHHRKGLLPRLIYVGSSKTLVLFPKLINSGLKGGRLIAFSKWMGWQLNRFILWHGSIHFSPIYRGIPKMANDPLNLPISWLEYIEILSYKQARQSIIS